MRFRSFTLVAAALSFAVSARILGGSHPTIHRGQRSAAEEGAIREQDIAFYRARAARDPGGAIDLAQLSALYLQRARASGDNTDLVRAEATARHSLQNRSGRNRKAQAVLASSLMAQHRFAEARVIAEAMAAADSSRVAQRATLAEIDLELGRYDTARKELASLTLYRTDLAVAPRLARLAELRGRPEEARRLLRDARDAARLRVDLPVEQLAWYQLRLGDIALRYGHLDEAQRELKAGLEVSPEDYRLLSALARLAAVRHRWGEAITFGERSIARAIDPATLGLLDDAYTVLGDTAKAGTYDRAMRLTVLRQPGPFHRAWSLFLLDHGREVPKVLAKVEEELQSRKDIYGYDLLAWALHRAGRNREAEAPMRRALSLGTRDAMLFYHAGMIDRSLGNDTGARLHLKAALAANPYWDPFHPAEARAVLDSLSRR